VSPESEGRGFWASSYTTEGLVISPKEANVAPVTSKLWVHDAEVW
jgi:hypothetical protein